MDDGLRHPGKSNPIPAHYHLLVFSSYEVYFIIINRLKNTKFWDLFCFERAANQCSITGSPILLFYCIEITASFTKRLSVFMPRTD